MGKDFDSVWDIIKKRSKGISIFKALGINRGLISGQWSRVLISDQDPDLSKFGIKILVRYLGLFEDGF